MKFVCHTADLAQACQNVERAASSKTAIPAIEGILMTTLDSAIKITGYDLEMGMTTKIPARIEEEGSLVLNARIFCDILRKLPGETVIIESDQRQLALIKSGDVEYSLIGIAGEEYPELPSVTGGYPINLSQNLLKDMIRKTIFSVAVKDTKAVHTGVKFEVSENKLRLVAVDGVRLAIRNEKINYSGETLSFVVPAKTLSEVVKLMPDSEEEMSVGVGKRHIIFEVGEYTIISRLLDGEFLNYKAAIPSSTKTVVYANTRDFIDSIERTSLIITDKLKSPVKCSFAADMISMSSVTSLGTASDRLNAKVQGDVCTVGFNNKYVLEALKVCDTDEVKVMLNGAVQPILICPPEGDSFVFLVLPVRLKNEN